MADLECVLEELKSKKARDPEGIERTIFKNTIYGSNSKNLIIATF